MYAREVRRPARRTVLALGAGTALAALPLDATASAAPARFRAVDRRLSDLEQEHHARLGVFGRNLRTGETVVRRADERFPMCSVWKTLAAAAVLRDLDRHGECLAERIHYTEADLVAHSPVTGTPEHLAGGMTVAELCAAAVSISDNTAANLLLRELGGPTAVTRFARSVGDPTTRLDRWETELNSAEPWRVEDTTSPRAIATTCARLVVGRVLNRPDRDRLTTWMRNSATNGQSCRAGLPADWTIADKTGSGDYGTNNDVGVTWTPDGTPIVLAVLTTHQDASSTADYPLVAAAAGLLADALG
ncbi:class A beta-lactamase [Streptomyces sp. NPDC051322]|uniref:class A beta-lactamase n=1 Tax=Streptomyces sp. NPDC051322 TaxID=3154645 RepID=UPI00344C90A2